jgi:hypothetical protein
MKATFRALVIVCTSAVAAAVFCPVTAQAAGTTVALKMESVRVAPADEYFGPLKLSILGMRNVLRDAKLRLERVAGDEPQQEFSRAKLTEACVRDWAAKYPRDGWLPGTLLSLRELYAKIGTDESRERAVNVTSWLIECYPRTAEAAQVRSALAQGAQSDAPASTAVSSPVIVSTVPAAPARAAAPAAPAAPAVPYYATTDAAANQ